MSHMYVVRAFERSDVDTSNSGTKALVRVDSLEEGERVGVALLENMPSLNHARVRRVGDDRLVAVIRRRIVVERND